MWCGGVDLVWCFCGCVNNNRVGEVVVNVNTQTNRGLTVLLFFVVVLWLFCGCFVVVLWLFCGVLQVPESFHGRGPSV